MPRLPVRPAPRPTRELPEYQRNVEAWAREVEQSLTAMQAALDALPVVHLGDVANPNGTITGKPKDIYKDRVAGSVWVKDVDTGVSDQGWV